MYFRVARAKTSLVNAEAKKIVATLGLKPLAQEGGYFRQTSASATGSAIYFLLTAEDFSAFHRLKTIEEVWHFYAGDEVEHVVLRPGGDGALVTRLGGAVLTGAAPQLVVPPGAWQGAQLAGGGKNGPSTGHGAGWALLGCTLVPAWDENDFELADRAELLRSFPDAAAQIVALTR